MFEIEARHVETRSVYVLSSGEHTFHVEIVRQFEDWYDEAGILVRRRQIGISVEGDLPMTIKNSVAACLRRGSTDEAQSWIDLYTAPVRGKH